MGKIGQAVRELERADELARRDGMLTRLHPAGKLALTLLYLVCVLSCGKYDLPRLILLCVYPLVLFEIGDLSFPDAVKRLRIVLPLLLAGGAVNPFLDREILFTVGSVPVSGGAVSMLSLFLKGALAVFASYLLVLTTPVEKLCAALRRFHVPKIVVTELLLIFRYAGLLLREAERMSTAYALRAPGQKGVAFRAWGSFLGQLLLRSMDRAEELYESMTLRGFEGEYPFAECGPFRARDLIWVLLWSAALLSLRLLPAAELLGRALAGA